MTELERAVVLIALLLLETLDAPQKKEAEDELFALVETLNARSESARGYHRGRRGIHALERVRAQKEEREVDYAEAERAAASMPPAPAVTWPAKEK